MIRTLIADDHIMFRQGLITLLNTAEDIDIVAECGDGRKALELIRSLEPDIAVLDISMPLMDGISIAQSIRTMGIATHVIMLTMHDDVLVYTRAVSAGASGYILKDDAYEELLNALRTVAAGGSAISPSMRNVSLEPDLRTPDLTEREKQILRLIAHGCTNRMIAEHLGISIKTVNNHRANLMGKLNLHSTAELVRYCLRMGDMNL